MVQAATASGPAVAPPGRAAPKSCRAPRTLRRRPSGRDPPTLLDAWP